MTRAFTLRRFATLFESDRRNVLRDPTLLFTVLFSAAPALAGYFFRDGINALVETQFGFADIFTYLLPIFVTTPAFMVGWVTGFLFLEDRDDGPLLAVDVTPLGKRGFMSYRVAVTAAIAFALTVLGTALLLPERGVATAFVLCVLVAMDAIGMALVLPALAHNKVEGLAVTKAVNILSFAPLLALLPVPWRYIGGFIPTFWIGEIIFNAPAFPALAFIVSAVLGIGVHLGVVWLLYRLQARRAG
jgi:fluoroquinolone transport system permease protein